MKCTSLFKKRYFLKKFKNFNKSHFVYIFKYVLYFIFNLYKFKNFPLFFLVFISYLYLSVFCFTNPLHVELQLHCSFLDHILVLIHLTFVWMIYPNCYDHFPILNFHFHHNLYYVTLITMI